MWNRIVTEACFYISKSNARFLLNICGVLCKWSSSLTVKLTSWEKIFKNLKMHAECVNRPTVTAYALWLHSYGYETPAEVMETIYKKELWHIWYLDFKANTVIFKVWPGRFRASLCTFTLKSIQTATKKHNPSVKIIANKVQTALVTDDILNCTL